MKIPVHSVLFRKLQTSNASMFLGLNRGEHDLRFGVVPELATFVADLPAHDQTNLGGWTKTLHLQPLEVTDTVAAQDLRLRFWGPQGSRANTYYIASQTSSPYSLWAPARARPGATTPVDLEGDVALVIRDANRRFHGRWVHREDLGSLPRGLQIAIDHDEKGVWVVPNANTQPSQQVAAIIDALRAHHNVLLYGPPGTGKTHLVTEVRRHFASSGVTLDTSAEEGALTETGGIVHSEWATFHQSYSYEDFLIGLRPKPLSGGGFELVPRPGILLELAEWARIPGNESLLIIDEINRGNVSRVFGEFITLMEPDKRLDPDGVETAQTVAVRLPFLDSGEDVEVSLPSGATAKVPSPFTIPRPLFTLATMNSVDKSVAPLDAALRRRFHIINISPDLTAFRSRLGVGPDPITREKVPPTLTSIADARSAGIAGLEVLNARIALFLGPDFQFGEWFLAPLIDVDTDEAARRALAAIWWTAVMPQLEDYFVGRADQLAKVLGDPRNDEEALIVDSPDTSYVELGAVQAIRANPRANDEAIVRFIAKVARSGLPASQSEGVAVLEPQEPTENPASSINEPSPESPAS